MKTKIDNSPNDHFHLLEEPLLEFGNGQVAEDPHDGLALFGPAERTNSLADHVVIGAPTGITLWRRWCETLNAPASCESIARHRPWPPYPGFDVAFGCTWPNPSKEYTLDSASISKLARKPDRYERAYAVASAYLKPIEDLVPKLDSKPAIAVCVVSDEVYANCRPQSYVADPSEDRKDTLAKKEIKRAIKDRSSGQKTLDFVEEPENIEQYGMSPDFRRQLKARVMQHGMPVQIVKESTLAITEQVRLGQPGVNPLSDRLWNLGTGLFYKSGKKPWKTPWAREGVCYIGIAYRQDERDRRSACCAAQMFLDSGDGIVFVGEFGPWYSEASKEFHLTKNAAEELLRGTIATYMQQDGRELKEVFLHARSGLNGEEFAGFKKACPEGVKLTGIRVRRDNRAPRVFRHGDETVPAADRGKYPVLRGTFWRHSKQQGYLFTSGFKPRIASYDGWEVPVPLTITVQHGEADIIQVAQDILGLTKLNYNACVLGESQPITVKYSDKIGEILLANPEVPSSQWKYNFKYYL